MNNDVLGASAVMITTLLSGCYVVHTGAPWWFGLIVFIFGTGFAMNVLNKENTGE